MRRFLAVLLVLVLCAVGFGFYRGWFSLSSHTSDNQNSKELDIKLSLDRDKLNADAQSVKKTTTQHDSK